MNVTHEGIITLLRSGVTGEKLSLPGNFILEEAFGILRRQSVVPLAYQGAVNCGVDKDNPVMQKMLMICYQNLIKHELQMKAIDGIFETFEANAIPYMPVKGCNIKGIYPKPEMRSMGDVDILIHEHDHDRIFLLMKTLGFCFKAENDHVYEWHSNSLHVELHKTLISPDDEDYYSYYQSGWQLAARGAGYRYDLTAEDAYVFMFAHFAHHYRLGGIGCRHVVDLFVYRKAYPNLDMTYIKNELDKLHLLRFHEHVVQMLNSWFLDEELEETGELITAFVFSGGNWGTMEAAMFSAELIKAKRTRTIKNSKAKTVIHLLFPSIGELVHRYPIIRKYPILLPVIWIIRWFDILLFRPQKIRRRLNILKTIDDETIVNREKALRAVGLDLPTSV